MFEPPKENSSKFSKMTKLEPQMWPFSKIDKAAESMSENSNKLGSLCDSIKNFFSSGSLTEEKDRTLLGWSLMKNLMFYMVSPTYAVAATAIVLSLTDIGLTTFSHYSNLLAPITNLFKGVESKQQQSSSIESQGEDSSCVKLWSDTVSNIMSVALITFGIKQTYGKLEEEDKDALTFVKYLVTWVRPAFFCNNLFKEILEKVFLVVKKIWEWCSVKIFGSGSIEHLFVEEPEFLKDWALDVQYLTDSSIEEKILEGFELSTRVIERHIQGKILQVYMSQETRSTPALALVKSLVDKISKLYDKVIERRKYSPARYEPYVIWMTGSPKIGKSFLINSLTRQLLDDVYSLKTDDPIYYRNPGSQYWNTLGHQPAVCYDDFMAVQTDGATDHIAEFFALKTSAAFNPPMAALEDKKKYFNPYIVIVTSNTSFPKSPKVSDQDAFWRRRDLLVEAELDPKYSSIDKVPEDVLATFGHLTFKRWVRKSGAIGFSDTDGNFVQAEDYNTFYANIKQQMIDYNTKESVNLAKRIKLCNAVMVEEANKCKDLKTISKNFFDKLSKLERTNSKKEDSFLSKFAESMKQFTVVPNMGNKNKNLSNVTSPVARVPQYNKFDNNTYSSDSKVSLWPDDQNLYYFSNNAIIGEGFPCTTTCLHDHFKNAPVKYKKNFTYHKSILGKSGICSTTYSESLGGPFNVLIPFVDNYYESCFFIPDEKCSMSDCSYTKESFAAVIKSVYEMNISSNMSYYEVPEDLVAKGDVRPTINTIPIVRAFTNISESSANKYWVVQDGDTRKAFKKEGNATKSWLVKIYEFICGMGKWLLYILTAFLTLFGISKVYKYFKSDNVEVIEEDLTKEGNIKPELHPSGDSQTIKLAKTNRSQVKSIKPQMDEQYLGSIRKGVERNTCFILAYEDLNDTSPIIARCLGICDNKLIGLKHYFERFMHCEEFTFKLAFKVSKEYTFVDIDLDELIIHKFNDSGLCFVELPWRIPSFKDIRERFYPKKEIVEITRDCELIEIQLGDPPTHYHKKVSVDYIKDTWVEPSHYSKGWNIVSGFTYPYGGKGVCGSVLVSLSKRPYIVGIHSSGAHNGKMGISEIVTRNDLMTTVKIIDRIVPEMDDCNKAKFQLEGVMVPLGCDPSPVRLSQDSRIRPSMMHGLFETHTVPAPLTSRDPRVDFEYSPLKYGCEKQTLVCKPLPVSVVDECVDSYFNMLDVVVTPGRVLTDLTYLESVNGLMIDGYEGIEMSTSEGYPWVKCRPHDAINKRWMFEFKDDKVVEINSLLVTVMNQKQKLRNDKIVPITVFMDCLKDCRIPKEKLNTPGKTRVFNIQPLDYTIQGRQYFLDYLVAYRNARLDAEHTIGINVNGFEWSKLYHKLNRNSKYIIAGDFKSFGDILDTYACKKIFERICNWYDVKIPLSKFRKARRVTMDEFLQAVHVAYDLVYMVMNGQPSGCSWTTEMNSKFNSVLFRVAFVILTGKNVNEFSKYIKIVTNGDDMLASVHESIIPVFNNVELQKLFKSFGIIYTDPKKTGDIQPYYSIMEVQYLKCHFVPHPYLSNEYMAKLEIESIEDCCQWIWKSEDEIEASLVNSQACVRLAYGHGPEFYERLRSILKNEWNKRGIIFDCPSWKSEDRRIWSTDDVRFFLPQMDDAHGAESVNVEKQGSTVLETQRGASEGSMAASESDNTSLSMGESKLGIDKYSELVGRWLLVKNFQWKESHGTSTEVLEMKLPLDAIIACKDVPNIVPFTIHRYWRGDMEIKVVVNSNKFQIGQLQISWYYCADEDNCYNKCRKNVYNASQRMHGLVSAGSSNEVILNIPYRHYLTSLYTSVVGKYVTSSLDLGRLLIMPINPLQVTSSVYNVVNCQVLIRFTNSLFSATVDRSLGAINPTVENQMEAALGLLPKIAEMSLNMINSDVNRDNPPQVRNPPTFVPIVSHSFVTGKNDVEYSQCMRLDPLGQTPHPQNLPDEMSVSHLVSTFGLWNKVKWSSDDNSGKLIQSIEMAPLLQASLYQSMELDSETFRFLPPLASVSSFFCYWRGDIEYRLDVVASQFHSGKILIAFVPGLQKSGGFTMNQAQGSPYQIFDIQEGRQLVFKAPYVACRPWWPVKFSSGEESIIREALGQVLIYVLNPLIPMDNVPKIVEINIYIRGGPNFEFSIPCTPKHGSALYSKVERPLGTETHIANGYGPSFTTYSKTYLDGLHLTVYKTATSGAISYWSNLEPNIVYQKKDKISIDQVEYDHKMEYYNKDYKLKEIKYCVKAFWQSYPIVYVFDDLEQAKEYIKWKDPVHALPYVKSGPWEQYLHNNVWTTIPPGTWVYWHKVAVVMQIRPQLGENQEVDAPVTSLLPPVDTTGFGNKTFGEACSDMKDVCRRYSRYYSPIKLDKFDKSIHTWDVSMPIMNQRPCLRIEAVNSLDNLLREGHISLLSSAYRFARGGLRFRMVFYGVDKTEQVFVQFRPDIPCYSDEVVVFTNPTPNFTSVMDPAYPCVYQGFVINNVIEFEIPWYMTGEYNLLQRIKFPQENSGRHQIVSEFASLGSIFLYLYLSESNKTRKNVWVETFYSLADDCRFSTFVGFPPMMFINQVSMPKFHHMKPSKIKQQKSPQAAPGKLGK